MAGGATVLIIDDEPLNVDLLEQELAAAGFATLSAADGERALELTAKERPDLILLDVMMPGLDGFAVCERLKAADATRDIPIIFLTALTDTIEKVRAFRAGAVDYLSKPFAPEELAARVGTHVALRRARTELEEQNARLREEIEAHGRSKATIHCLVEEIRSGHNFGELIGQSPALKRLLDQLELVASTGSTVLILGETGTGKELVARAIHGRSPRRDQPLVKVNCAALPRELVESELFGHEKGAFTGATQQRRGRFELADRGTIFLDEVGELPLEAQAKLLRVLQEREFERVGGMRSLTTDVRVIAATNRDLHAQVGSGTFRSDLYYRLNVFPVTVPPLRERPEDVPLLVRHFIARIARTLGKRFDGVDPDFLEQAASYDWPGNVRELENVVERAAILSRGSRLELAEPLCSLNAHTHSIAVEPASRGTLEDMERAHIRRVLEQTRWMIEGEQGAALILGLNPSTLRGRMRKLGLRRPS
jgi:formate hydrogenlyase transcriptional activator